MPVKLVDRVLGFAFNQDRTHILLLRSPERRSPEQLDVPGGPASFNEALVGAVAREFKTHTGLEVPPEAWKVFALMSGITSETRCMMAELDELAPIPPNAKWYSVTDADIAIKGAPNLRWLIPLALCDEGQRYVSITYRG